jgi:hypothetical protein
MAEPPQPPLIRRRQRFIGDAPKRRKGTHAKARNQEIPPRRYEKLVKLSRIYEMTIMRFSTAEIAKKMKLSEGRVKELIEELKSDFSCLAQTEEAKRIIDDNIAKFDLAIAKALEIMTKTSTTDRSRIEANNTYVKAISKKAEYEVLVGRVRKAPDDVRAAIGSSKRQARMEDLRDEISDESLEDTLRDAADQMRNKRKPAEEKIPA